MTHAGLTAGQQIAQISHAAADFARFEPEHFSDWHTNSQYIIALQTATAEELYRLLLKALQRGLHAIPFREPDLDHEITSVAFIPSEKNKKFLSNLPLAGKQLRGGSVA